MSYSTADGLTVERTAPDGTKNTTTVQYSDLTRPDDYSWTYTTAGDKSAYKITYYTLVDITGLVDDITVKNNAEDSNHPGGTGGSATVGPDDEDKLQAEKKVSAIESDYIDWDITINVPAGGFETLEVEEYLPNNNDSWYDAFNKIVSVTGLYDGEYYRTDEARSDYKKETIVFYTDDSSIALKPSTDGKNRTVVITVRTTTNESWLEDASRPGMEWEKPHTNTAKVIGNGAVKSTQATGVPSLKKFSKVTGDTKWLTYEGKKVPIFVFNVTIHGATDENLVIYESFDTEKFRLYDYSNQSNIEYLASPNNDLIYDNLKIYSYKDEWQSEGSAGIVTATYNEETGKYKLTTILNKKDGNTLYPKYVLQYALVPKDMTAFESVIAGAVATQDGKNTFVNTATWDGAERKSEFSYNYPGLDKQGAVASDDPSHIHYTLTINPYGKRLGDESTLTLTDTFKNLSVLYNTISVTSLNESAITTAALKELCSWDYSGNVGTFTLPNGYAMKIEYDARITGDAGTAYSNRADLLGYFKTHSGTRGNDSESSGKADTYEIKILKYKDGELNKGLAGARFLLLDSKKNPVLYENSGEGFTAGDMVIFTTDANGMADVNLNENTHGISLRPGVRYYLREIEAPEGYARDSIDYGFIISKHPDYNNYEYYSEDILKVRNTPAKGVIKVQKSIVGPDSLTETQRKALTYKVLDGEGNIVAEMTYDDFVKNSEGVMEYVIPNLEAGTYTVTETNHNLPEYTYSETKYVIDDDGTSEKVSGTQGTIDITSADVSNATPHTIAFTNEYSTSNASFSIKKSGEKDEPLYGAEFELRKKEGTEYVKYTGNAAIPEGIIKIDASNYKQGVSIYNLPAGDYQLAEIKAPSGYHALTSTIEFTVADGVATSYSGSNSLISYDSESKTFTVKNQKEHDFTIRKAEFGHGETMLPGATFTVYKGIGTSLVQGGVYKATELPAGAQVVATYVTDGKGEFNIKWDDTKYQNDVLYTIMETEAPMGYIVPDLNGRPAMRFYFGEGAISGAADAVNLLKRSGYAFIENKQESKRLDVVKTWKNLSGQDISKENQPVSEISFKLKRSSTKTAEEYYPDGDTVYTLTRDQYGNWSSMSFTELPKWYIEDGQKYEYTYVVEELPIEGYEAVYTTTDITGGTKTTITNRPESINLHVQKVWEMPDSMKNDDRKVTIQLYRDAEPTETPNYTTGGVRWMKVENKKLELKKENGWEDSFTDLPKGYRYHLVEDSVSGNNLDLSKFKWTVSDNNVFVENSDITVTNQMTDVGDQKIAVQKMWLNEDGSELATAPEESVKVELWKYRGVRNGGYKVEVPYKGAWSQGTVSKDGIVPGSTVTIELNFGGTFNTSSYKWPDGASYDENSKIITINSIQNDITFELIDASNDWFNEPKINAEVVPLAIDESDEGIKYAEVELNSGNNWYNIWGGLEQNYVYKLVETKIGGKAVNETDYTIQMDNYDDEKGIQKGIIYLKNIKSSPKVGSLSIKKQVSNGNADGKTFTFEVTLTNDNGNPYVGDVKVVDSAHQTATTVTTDGSGKLTVTVTGTGTATISEIPAGTKYEVTEPSANLPLGWSQVGGVDYGDNTKTIEANDEDTATVTNEQLGKLTVTKSLALNPVDSGTFQTTYKDKVYTVTITTGEAPNVKYLKADGTLSDTEETHTVSNATPLVIENVPAGTYTVTEKDTGRVIAGYKFDGVTGVPADFKAAIKGDEKTVALTNTYEESKTDIHILKVKDDGTTALDGATFSLTKTGGDQTFENQTTANGGKADFTGLKAGTYTLSETGVPAGYKGLTGYITFTLTESDDVFTLARTDETADVTLANDTFTFTVKNYETTDIEVTKEWKNSAGQDHTSNDDDTITFTLHQVAGETDNELATGLVVKYQKDGSYAYTNAMGSLVEGGAASGWGTTSITGLPKYTADGKAYSYYVVETAVSENGVTIETSYKVGTGEANGTASSVTVQNNTNPIVIVNQDVDTSTSIKAIKVDAHNNTTKLNGATFELKRVKDGMGADVTEEPVTQTTTGEGEAMGTATFGNLQAGTYELTETQSPAGYKTTFEKATFTVNRNGNTMTVTYTDETNGIVTYSSDNQAFTVTNEPLVDIEATKTWKQNVDDAGDLNATITNAEVTYTLYKKVGSGEWTTVGADGITNPVTLKVEDTANAEAWKASWTGLDKYSGEALISYKVVESNAKVNGETITLPSMAEVEASVYNTIAGHTNPTAEIGLTNTLPKTSISVVKSWKDTSTGKTTPPTGAKATLGLYKLSGADTTAVTVTRHDDDSGEDETVHLTVTLDGTQVTDPAREGIYGYAEDAWKATWKNLPKYDANGALIKYVVKEESTEPAMTFKPLYDRDEGKTYAESTVENQYTSFRVQKRWMSNHTTWNPKYTVDTIYYHLYKVNGESRELVGELRELKASTTIDVQVKVEDRVYIDETTKAILDKAIQDSVNGFSKSGEGDSAVYTIPYADEITPLPILDAGWSYEVVECSSAGAEFEQGDEKTHWVCNEFGDSVRTLKNDLTDVKATKSWDDKSNEGIIHPAITFTLKRTTDTGLTWENGKGYSKNEGTITWEDVDTYTIEANATGTALTKTWADQPKYCIVDGKKYTYYVEESSVLGYKLKNSQLSGEGYVFSFENELDTTELKVEKKWKINGTDATEEQLKTVPPIKYQVWREAYSESTLTTRIENSAEDITNALKTRTANRITGELPIVTTTGDESNQVNTYAWTEAVKDLPTTGQMVTTDDNGTPGDNSDDKTTYKTVYYKYYIVEEAGNLYPSQTTTANGTTHTLTNKLVDAEVTKLWQDVDGNTVEPENGTQITVTLTKYAYGENGVIGQGEVIDTITMTYEVNESEKNVVVRRGETVIQNRAATDVNAAWKYEWKNLAVDGTATTTVQENEEKVPVKYHYQIDETVVPGGYNRKTGERSEVKPSDAKITQEITNVKNPSISLPSTGGPGTTGLYVVGSILTLLALVLLITKKRTEGQGID